MLNIRRLYMYLVSAVSLQAVTWAIIALGRNLLLSGLSPSVSTTAFQIAVIIIGLPVFLGHWVWGNRLAARSAEERRDVLRRLYLYGSMAAFLAPLVANGFDFLGTLFGVDSTIARRPYGLSDGEALFYHLVAIIVLGALWFYHQQLLNEEMGQTPSTVGGAIIRRLYVLAFSAAGLAMTILGLIELVRWFMFLVGVTMISASAVDATLAVAATRLIVGIPVWLIFWYQAQRLFDGPSEAERDSTLRKLYLYLAVFIGSVGSVASATTILAGIFRRVLGLDPEGDIRIPLSIIIGMVLLWFFHTLVLREDEKLLPETGRQAGVRRLYLYLIAGVGLAVLLAGVAGNISVMIQTIADGFGDQLREGLAWFSAAVVAGLAVWPWPWRQVQNQALRHDTEGRAARQAMARKIYLYFYLFITTLTVLGGIIFIVAELLVWLLGGDAPVLSELGHAIAFSLIALVVWLYHGSLLLKDNRLLGQEAMQRLEDLHLVILASGGRSVSQAVVDALKQDAPSLDLAPIQVDASTPANQETLTRLAQADVIVTPWDSLLMGEGATAGIGQAIVSSSAHKLLMPATLTGWDWVGLEASDTEKMVEQTVQAIKQIAANESVGQENSWGLGAIIGAVIGLFIVLMLIIIPIIEFISRNF